MSFIRNYFSNLLKLLFVPKKQRIILEESGIFWEKTAKLLEELVSFSKNRSKLPQELVNFPKNRVKLEQALTVFPKNLSKLAHFFALLTTKLIICSINRKVINEVQLIAFGWYFLR